MTMGNRLANARAELAAAKDAGRVAEMIHDAGALRDAMSRAYYAVFHGARALVFLEDAEPKTHRGLLHLFNDLVVRTGRMSAHDNLLLVRLQAYRQAADYAVSFEIDAEDGGREIAAAREFVERAARLVEAAAHPS